MWADSQYCTSTAPDILTPVFVLDSTYKDPESNVTIDFFQLNITTFQAQIYPNLAKTSLVGYNGISPGPTFRVRRGIQSVIRVVNHNGNCSSSHDMSNLTLITTTDKPSVLHLHGSYSRAVWDGWAEDLIQPGQYKDYYLPNSNTARTLWYHGAYYLHSVQRCDSKMEKIMQI